MPLYTCTHLDIKGDAIQVSWSSAATVAEPASVRGDSAARTSGARLATTPLLPNFDSVIPPNLRAAIESRDPNEAIRAIPQETINQAASSLLNTVPDLQSNTEFMERVSDCIRNYDAPGLTFNFQHGGQFYVCVAANKARYMKSNDFLCPFLIYPQDTKQENDKPAFFINLERPHGKIEHVGVLGGEDNKTLVALRLISKDASCPIIAERFLICFYNESEPMFGAK